MVNGRVADLLPKVGCRKCNLYEKIGSGYKDMPLLGSYAAVQFTEACEQQGLLVSGGLSLLSNDTGSPDAKNRSGKILQPRNTPKTRKDVCGERTGAPTCFPRSGVIEFIRCVA